MENNLDVSSFRSQFPALRGEDGVHRPIFLDGPGGTQVPDRVIEAMVAYLSTSNANTHGAFATSRASDRIIGAAHSAIADLVNAPSPDEIVFGANMTTLTLHLSRSIGRTLEAGDEILVTEMEHDANVAPWVLAARDAGASVKAVRMRTEDCTLDLEDLEKKLTPRTRLLALTCASNAVGTLNDVKTAIAIAHARGALVYLDAVHVAPHAPIDVQAWDADFLACSAYKFFGPHVGALWGRREHLERLSPYKVRPAPDALPGRWMTGTQNHEGLAGVVAAVDYIAEIGRRFGERFRSGLGGLSARRGEIRAGLLAIQSYEAGLSRAILRALAAHPKLKVWGIADPERAHERVPTVALTMNGQSPEAIARYLAASDIYVWSGNMYAISVTERLGLEASGGVVRIGLLHYNTTAEIERLIDALDTL